MGGKALKENLTCIFSLQIAQTELDGFCVQVFEDISSTLDLTHFTGPYTILMCRGGPDGTWKSRRYSWKKNGYDIFYNDIYI